MKNKKTSCLFISIVVTLLMTMPCFGENINRHRQDRQDGNLFLFPIHLYRKYMSGADGDRCPMYPSCSAYSLEAFKKHGPLKGWVMTCDRLMRCGRDEVGLASPVFAKDRKKAYDPVNNNDFWWYKSAEP